MSLWEEDLSLLCVWMVCCWGMEPREDVNLMSGNLSWGLDRMSDPFSSEREHYPRALPLGRLDSRLSDGLCSK